MTKELSETSTHTGIIVVPTAGDKVTAGSVEVPLQSLTNRTKNHLDRIVPLEAWRNNPDIDESMVVTVGDIAGRLFGIEDLFVGNGSTVTAATILGWPSNGQLGFLRCSLTSVVDIGADPTAAPHFGFEVRIFAVRRDFSGNVVSVSDAGPTAQTSGVVDNIVVLANSSPNLLVQVESLGSSDSNNSLVITAQDGPRFSVP